MEDRRQKMIYEGKFQHGEHGDQNAKEWWSLTCRHMAASRVFLMQVRYNRSVLAYNSTNTWALTHTSKANATNNLILKKNAISNQSDKQSHPILLESVIGYRKGSVDPSIYRGVDQRKGSDFEARSGGSRRPRRGGRKGEMRRRPRGQIRTEA